MSTKELSKNEQKKLAKKAEKAAKKQQQQGGGGQQQQGGGQKQQQPAAVPAPAPAANKSFKLGYVDQSSCSLKVAWASQLFHIPLGILADPGDELKNHSSFFFSDKKPMLVYGSSSSDSMIIGGGGNAMAKALSYCSGDDGNNVVQSVDQLRVDEWCEWERTTLRPLVSSDKNNKNKKKQLDAALQHLSTALEASPTGIHLVKGHEDSVADVVLLVTLSQLAAEDELPGPVAAYVKAHEETLGQVRKTVLGKLLQQQEEAAKAKAEAFAVDLTNPSLLTVCNSIFRKAMMETFDSSSHKDIIQLFQQDDRVNRCSNPKHGDYQFTGAMPLFALLKKSGKLPNEMKSPQQVAKAVVDTIGTDHAVLNELSVQGPGFILCRVSPGFLQNAANRVLRSGQLPKPKDAHNAGGGKDYTCVVDFSSPNIAKEMHVGHLRSTIIGESVCRILEYMGYTVKRINHVGDWGTQFGMLIQYLKEEYPNALNDSAELPNITDLTEFYKNAKARFDESADFKKTSQLNVVKLQSGDEECMAIWKLLCDISRKEFQKVYNRLDVSLVEVGESFYNDKIAGVIELFDKAGLMTIEEGGAKCVFPTGYKNPLMLQKSDGGYGYDSTDMTALKYRIDVLNAKRIIYITDFSQEDHFEMCFRAGKQIGWITDDNNIKLQHIGFGTVQGEDGKRFKTRSGDTVRLVDLLDEAVSRMEQSLKDRLAEGKANITEDEIHEVAEAIGYGAVKYFDLHRNPTSNYKFSYDHMLDTKGNTAVYLLYARVRLESIIAKAKKEHGTDIEQIVQELQQKKDGETKEEDGIQILHPSERNLALYLQLFPDTMTLVLDKLYPYYICDYVYNLSIASSEFVTQCKVLGSPEMKSRLLLCHVTTLAFRQCFDLLGIRHVKRI